MIPVRNKSMYSNGMLSGINLFGHRTTMHFFGFNVGLLALPLIVICLTAIMKTLASCPIISTQVYFNGDICLQLHIFKLLHETTVTFTYDTSATPRAT